MEKEEIQKENLLQKRSKTLHKWVIGTIKVAPIIIGGMSFINAVLTYFEFTTIILNYLVGVSLLFVFILFLLSYELKFCVWHRLLLYYIVLYNMLSIYDLYIGIPVNNQGFLIIHLGLAALFLLLIVRFYAHE